MAENSLNVRIQHAVEHIENINNEQIQAPASDSVPIDGEIIFNQSRTNFKVGDGITEYDSLSYILPEIPERCIIITPSNNSHLTDLYSDSLLINPNATKFSVFEPGGTIRLMPNYVTDDSIQIFMLNLNTLNSKLINDVEYTFDFNMRLNNNSPVSNPDNVFFVCTNIDQNQYIFNYTDWGNEVTRALNDIVFRGFQKPIISPSSSFSYLKCQCVKIKKHTVILLDNTEVTYFFIY